MFTGLIADLGEIAGVERTAEGARLTLNSGLADQLAEGDSVSVNGVCLTATRVSGGSFGVDVMNETLRLSSLAEASAGAAVNLELAMRADTRLGGHLVQGHVDGVGAVAERIPQGEWVTVWVTCPPVLAAQMVSKGSV
ncbi:MAG: riboflavin synthase, partial [Acidobacteriota bacterium]|nr:riboflavin synthase [Acidobacteriota bacterium]